MDLVSLVQDFGVSLRQVVEGEFVGLCPFHSENTPSFRVSEKRYHCFGCGVHGDVISWLVRTTGCSFKEAKEKLSSGEVGEYIKPKQRKVQNYSEYDAKEVLTIFEDNLAIREELEACTFESMDDVAKDYISNRVDHDTMVKFGITYSHARDRMVIPLLNRKCHTIGLAGRLIPRPHNQHLPKYINPKNDAAFQRNRYLYGLHLFDESLKQATLVEGFMDCISLTRLGAKNVLSVMGTAIGEGQLNYLEALGVKKITLMLDGDMAGLEAVYKASKQFYDAPFDVTAILLTNDSDPDSIFHTMGHHAGDFLRSMPKIKLTDFMKNELTQSNVKGKKWDLTNLLALTQPYVAKNIKEGFPHYNVVDWVCQAWPMFRPKIKAALKRMHDDPLLLPDGRFGIKPEHVEAFIKEWKKPCREVRMFQKRFEEKKE